MNKVVLMGRLVRDPDTRYTTGETQTAVTRYTLAVDRRGRRDGQTADFIPCIAFGRAGEFAEKYFSKGMRVVVSGRIQTGSYTDRNGVKRNTTEIVIEDQEFAESKAESEQATGSRTADIRAALAKTPEAYQESFMDIPADADDDGLPFN